MAPTDEPDNMNDAVLKKFGPAPSGQSSGALPPKHKPPVPETGADANSMDRLMSGVSSSLKNSNNLVNASSLNVDHPYGDGQHTETASDTLARLGAGRKYGE